jgi:hypothetical protein
MVLEALKRSRNSHFPSEMEVLYTFADTRKSEEVTLLERYKHNGRHRKEVAKGASFQKVHRFAMGLDNVVKAQKAVRKARNTSVMLATLAVWFFGWN